MLIQREATAAIVVCGDDETTLDLLCDRLIGDGFMVLPAPTPWNALKLCHYARPDLLVLDLAMEHDDGDYVLRLLRGDQEADVPHDPKLPIVLLGGPGEDMERFRDLAAEVDEYVQKPFSYDQLLGRIQAVLRRRHSRQDTPVRIGEMLIDPSRHKVTIGDRDVDLAKKEFTLLRVLATDPTRVFSKEELLRDVWGSNVSEKTRTLDSHASRLRRKLDPDGRKYVVNCWGIGYRLVKG